MSDSDKTLKLVIDLEKTGTGGVAAKAELDDLKGAAKTTADDMGVITVTQKDIEKATQNTTDAVEKGTDKWGEGRREIREVGTEIGRATGISRLGGLALGGLAAAAFGAGKAIEFLKDTWSDMQSAIKGPLEIGIPEDAPSRISAAAQAWEEYATARSKVIASQTGPEATGSAEEKRLTNELRLIKEVLAAEKEKALADLEMQRNQMSPEAFKAAQENIKNIFGDAESAAEQRNRRLKYSNKEGEAANLEIDAKLKTQQALDIKVAPEDVAERNQKTLDANAAKADSALVGINEKIARNKRLQTYWTGGDVAEYEGLGGKAKVLGEGWEFQKEYGYGKDTAGALKLEETRKAQAQAIIDQAADYKVREEAARASQKKLMDEAGTESGKAANLRKEAGVDAQADRRQSSVDTYVSSLHQASANQIEGANAKTVEAVERFTGAVLGGFLDLHGVLNSHQRELDQLRRQIENARNTGTGG